MEGWNEKWRNGEMEKWKNGSANGEGVKIVFSI